jgi:predicted nucleotidyltransferase
MRGRPSAEPARRREAEAFIAAVGRWARTRSDLVAVALVGSWARNAAHDDSDVDLIVLTDEPALYLESEDWIGEFAPGARLLRTGDWGAIVERRLELPSGLEVEVGVGQRSWGDTTPTDPGTLRVVRDGLRPIHDPQGLLATLAASAV